MTQIKAGDKCPEFQGIIQDGSTVQLSDFKGKKLVIYFYPKDNTPTCTVQSCNLRDNYKELLNKGYEVLGISADSEKSHEKFIAKQKLPFNLIADTDKTILNQFGVWGPKKFMGRTFDGIHRTTFVVDENGIIIKVIEKVKAKVHTEQITEE